MSVPEPYGQILFALVTLIVLSGMVAGSLAMGSQFQMWSQRTAKASSVAWFLPWWPWIDGMLTEEGIKSRKRYARAAAVFLACWLSGAIVLGGAAVIWQR